MELIDNCILIRKKGMNCRLNKIKKTDNIVKCDINQKDVVNFNQEKLLNINININDKNKQIFKKDNKMNFNNFLDDFYNKNKETKKIMSNEDNLYGLNTQDLQEDKPNKLSLKINSEKENSSKKKNDKNYITINEIKINQNYKDSNSIKLDGLVMIKNKCVKTFNDFVMFNKKSKTLYEEFLEKNEINNDKSNVNDKNELFNILNNNKVNFMHNAINHSISLNKINDSYSNEFSVKNEKVVSSEQNQVIMDKVNLIHHRKFHSMFNTNNEQKINDDKKNLIYLKKHKLINNTDICNTDNTKNKSDNLNDFIDINSDFINFLNNYDYDEHNNRDFAEIINTNISLKCSVEKQTRDEIYSIMNINSEIEPVLIENELNNSFSTKKTIITKGTNISDIKSRYFEKSYNESILTKKITHFENYNNYDQVKSLKTLKPKKKYIPDNDENSNKFKEKIDEKLKIFTESIFDIKAKLNFPNYKKINFQNFLSVFFKNNNKELKNDTIKLENLNLLLMYLNYDISLFNSSRSIRNLILEVTKHKAIKIYNDFISAYSRVLNDCKSYIQIKENEVFIMIKFKFQSLEKIIESLMNIKLKTKVNESYLVQFSYDYEINKKIQTNKYSFRICNNIKDNFDWICNEYFTGGENLIYKNPILSVNSNNNYVLNLKIDLKSKYGITENIIFNSLSITFSGKYIF